MRQSHKAVKEKGGKGLFSCCTREVGVQMGLKNQVFSYNLYVFMNIILSFFDNATWCPHAKCTFSQVMCGTLWRAAAFGEEELSKSSECPGVIHGILGVEGCEVESLNRKQHSALFLGQSSPSSGVISVSLCTTTLVTDMSGCCSLASFMA